jgi:hypothetical protein
LAVIGDRCSGFFGFFGGFGAVLTVGEAPPLAEVEIDPATTPPAMAAAELVVPARAGAAQTATVKLEQSTTPSVRNRTSSTSFVGLRG